MTQDGIIQKIVLPSSLDNLSRIEVFVDEICEQLRIGEDQYGNILIALTEAVNNAIIHGNKSISEKSVSLSVEIVSSFVEFKIQDEGPGFDYTKVPDPTLPENLEKLNGRGLFLMQNLADEVLFDENGTCVILKFSLSIS